ncbi:MAG: hypothetical protein AAB227_04895 [Pseudomonadota bacterium]
MTKPRPFNFDEFRASAPTTPEAPRVRTFTAEDLAAAREEGVAEGRRLAMDTIAASEAAQLEHIAERLDGAREALQAEIDRTRETILTIARVFLDEFALGLASERETALAEDLLRRLTENSEDRRSARLYLNAKSLERLRPRLEGLLNARGVADFVALDGDFSLQPGEARLEWRGGETRRGRAEIAAAIAALFDPLADQKMEATHERA